MPRSSKKRRAAKELMTLKRKLRKLETYLNSDVSSFDSDSETTGSRSSPRSSDEGPWPLDTNVPTPEAADGIQPVVMAPSTSADPAPTRIFAVLGDSPPLPNTVGPDIHEELSVRWSAYLTKGIPQESRKLFLEKYAIPGNCTGLQAPKMNEEVKAVLPNQVNKNDYFLSSLQNQLGSGLTAIARILDRKLRDPEATIVLTEDVLLSLADAAQCFASVHHALSLKRRFEASHLLNDDSKAATAQSPIDSFLFGSAFTEKIKSRQDMKKTAAQLRKTYTHPTPGPSVARPLNFKRPASKARQKEDKGKKERGPQNRTGFRLQQRTQESHRGSSSRRYSHRN